MPLPRLVFASLVVAVGAVAGGLWAQVAATPPATPPTASPTTSPTTAPAFRASTAPDAVPQLVFKTGFEGTRIVPRTDNTQHEFLVGNDAASPAGDWDKDLAEKTPYFGKSYINYEQGTHDLRRAEIVPDPADPTGKNQVLRYRIFDQHILMPSGERKSRIQQELQNRRPAPEGGYIREYYQSVRLMFSENFRVLMDAPSDERLGWIVMQEFWNDPQWIAPGRTVKAEARTGIGIVRKPNKAGSPLRFDVGGRDPVMEVPRPGNNSWLVVNEDFAIPLGKWMTQEIYIKEGGTTTGRFYLAITVDGVKTVIVDKTGMTTSEEPGYVPDGQTAWNPTKIYTEGRVLSWFKAQNKPMELYWDDLEIWINRRPETQTPTP